MTVPETGAWIIWWRETSTSPVEKVIVIGGVLDAFNERINHADAYEAGMYTTKMPEPQDGD